MTVDREQIRRDAEDGNLIGWKTVLALLAELEQAERERDEANLRSATALRAQAEGALTQNRMLNTIRDLEAQLAKVPALVEAGKGLRATSDKAFNPGGAFLDQAQAEWDEAIAAFEQEQKP